MIVLAVDDDPASLMITRSAMRALGHECVCAASGEDAWRSFLVRRPDVIVSDWSMPGMSGLELCRRIRALESDEYTYFILVTGHGTSQEVRVGMDAGVDEYLVKPVRLGDLEARMIAAGRVTSLLRHLSRQRVELEGLNSQLRSAASLDPLTGLGNRRALEMTWWSSRPGSSVTGTATAWGWWMWTASSHSTMRTDTKRATGPYKQLPFSSGPNREPATASIATVVTNCSASFPSSRLPIANCN